MGNGKMPVSAVVAIDGPSGSGKSTVARKVAERFGFGYLDTGAMYRAATWWVMQKNITLTDRDAVSAAVRKMPLTVQTDPRRQNVICGDTDITDVIRTSGLSKVVSQVATNPDVRKELIRRQREIIARECEPGGFSGGKGIVAEGRDITTVVAPDADVRILLTASWEARLARRAREVRGSDSAQALAATRDEVLRRDRDDSAVSEFMTAQEGVTEIDSSNLTLEQTVDAVAALVGGPRGE